MSNAKKINVEEEKNRGEIVCIKLVAKKVVTKTGNTFLNFKLVHKGRFIDFRFKKEVNHGIVEEGKYYIDVELDKLNLDSNREFPCYWYGGVVENVMRIKSKPITDL